MVADLSKATSPLLRVQVYVPASADEIVVMDSCPGTDVLNLMSVELMAVEFRLKNLKRMMQSELGIEKEA